MQPDPSDHLQRIHEGNGQIVRQLDDQNPQFLAEGHLAVSQQNHIMDLLIPEAVERDGCAALCAQAEGINGVVLLHEAEIMDGPIGFFLRHAFDQDGGRAAAAH